MSVGARVAAWCAVIVLGAGVMRTVVLLPEHCGDASPAVVEGAARDAVAWFGRNQRVDGTWLYRYDVAAQRDRGGYSWVRHAGVLLSLEHAAAAGFAGARDPAEAGRSAIVSRLVSRGDRTAVEDGRSLTAGGTGLLVAALGERRLSTGQTGDDDLLRAMGRFLVGQVESDGSVNEKASVASGAAVHGTHSPFSTGETMFALARLERLFPGEGWAEPVRRIGRYLATERADREGYVPDTSDHWAAYAFAERSRWPGGPQFTAEELGFARKQMGIVSIQVRYESQRTNGGVDRWTRGRQALGAGVGTLGEALGAWSRVAAASPALAGQRGWLHDRLACAAGMLAARQTSSPDTRADGAFLQFGVTQMDDQQHPLSALVAAQTELGDGQQPRRTPVPSSPWLVALAALVVLNPARVGAGSRRRPTRTAAAGVAAGVVVLSFLAAVGGPIVRALDVSVGTAAVAAGLAVAAAGLGAAIWARRSEPEPLLIPLVLRPELALLGIAVGAGGRGWPFVGGLVTGALLSMVAAARHHDIVSPWLIRIATVVTILAGIAITVDGVYAV